jgi:hypothetical protein
VSGAEPCCALSYGACSGHFMWPLLPFVAHPFLLALSLPNGAVRLLATVIPSEARNLSSVFSLGYGGDSATGSGGRIADCLRRVQPLLGRRGIPSWRRPTCSHNWKWLLSLAAIVAPPVRLWSGARSVLAHQRVPFSYFFFFPLAFLPVLRSMPLPQYPESTCSRILTISLSVQTFESRPSTIPGVGAGICFFRIQRRSVLRSTSKTLAASEIEYALILNMPHMDHLSSTKSYPPGHCPNVPRPPGRVSQLRAFGAKGRRVRTELRAQCLQLRKRSGNEYIRTIQTGMPFRSDERSKVWCESLPYSRVKGLKVQISRRWLSPVRLTIRVKSQLRTGKFQEPS